MPLENRRWFGLLALVLSAGLTALLWRASALPFSWRSVYVFLLATLGLNLAVNKGLALLCIRFDPTLGDVGPLRPADVRDGGASLPGRR